MAAASAPLPEELEFELEALRATYGEEAVSVEPAPTDGGAAAAAAARVSLPVAPRCAAEHECFVAGRLVLAVPDGYPAEAPGVQLADAKGVGDVRLAGMQAALAAEAAQLAGELQLGHLAETALDLLTAANEPEGDCAFCLEPLLAAGRSGSNGGGGGSGGGGCCGGGRGSGPALLRLGCYHAYHAACFAPWWHWQQDRMAQRERQLWDEYRSMAPLKLKEEGIRREGGSGGSALDANGEAGKGTAAVNGSSAGDEAAPFAASAAAAGCGGSASGAFVLACPSCRADVLPSSLAHARQQLQAASADTWSKGRRAALPAEQRQQLAAMQQRHAEVLRRQQACGGLVEETHSVSLSDLQAAATAAAAGAAAAEAAAAAAAAEAAAAPAPPLQRGGRGGGRGGARGRGREQPDRRGLPPGVAGRGGQHGRGGSRGGGRGHGCAPPLGAAGPDAPSSALEGLCLGGAAPQQQPAQQQRHLQSGGRHRGGGSGRGRGGPGRGRGRGGEVAAAAAPAAS